MDTLIESATAFLTAITMLLIVSVTLYILWSLIRRK